MIIRAFASAALLTVLSACSFTIEDRRGPVPGETQQLSDADFAKRTHDYLLAHPEVIGEVQMAAMQKQQAARQAKAKSYLAEKGEAVFHDPADAVLGNGAGPITVVEFFDVQCPFCKKISPDLAELLKTEKDVRLVLKEFPILDAVSTIAAHYELAARQQGAAKFEALHTALMADQTQEHQLTEAHILDLAKSAGLDIDRLRRDKDAPDIAAHINANRAVAQQLGITGTPGLVIGTHTLDGAVSLDILRREIADLRAGKT